MRLEETGVHALDEVHRIGQSVCFEQRAAYLGVAQFDQAVGQLGQLLLGGGRSGLDLQGPLEQADEGGQRELVHVVHLDQVAEHHEEVAADHCELAVHFALLVQGHLQVLGLAQRSFDLGRLRFSLVKAVDETLVLQDVALRVG